MSQVEGGRFARVGSHLPTEPSSRPRPSREKFGLNASTMVSCARHSEGKEGEKEGRNCGGAASFSFSLAAQVNFRRFTGRSGSRRITRKRAHVGVEGVPKSDRRAPTRRRNARDAPWIMCCGRMRFIPRLSMRRDSRASTGAARAATDPGTKEHSVSRSVTDPSWESGVGSGVPFRTAPERVWVRSRG